MAGLDGMGNSRVNTIPDSVVANAGPTGTTGDSYAAAGGFALEAIAQNQLPNIVPTISGSVAPTGSVTPTLSGSHTYNLNQTNIAFGSASAPSGSGCVGCATVTGTETPTVTIDPSLFTVSAVAGSNFSVNGAGFAVSSINGNVSQQNLNMMTPFILGTWYMKLANPDVDICDVLTCKRHKWEDI